MSTISQPTTVVPKPELQSMTPMLRNMWAGVAIAVIWLAVLFCALFGPDFVATSGGGTNQTTIPSGVFVALFAWLATAAVAKHGLTRSDEPGS